jgi:N-acyl homoserine lactone hydrolase
MKRAAQEPPYKDALSGKHHSAGEHMSVRITPMVCGWLEMELRSILAQQPGRVKIPIPSFLIEHPKGRVIFDTGLHRELQTSSDRIGELAKFFQVHYQSGEELGARLRARQIDPERIDYMINSHLHFDHVGGNADLPNAKLIVQRREWDAAADPELVRRNGYNRADFDLGHQLQLLDGEHDLFGTPSFCAGSPWTRSSPPRCGGITPGPA